MFGPNVEIAPPEDSSMLRSAISVWSILILSILASATASAQSFDFGSLNSANALTGGNSNSSTSSSNSSSRTSTGASSNPNAGVSEFSINTDNVQNAATGFVGGNASQAFVGGAREATNQRATNRQFGAFQNTQNTSNTQSSQTGTPRSIRTTLKIAFAAPSGTFAQQAGALATSNSVQLTQFSTNRPELSGVNVELTADGVALLTGTSPNAEAGRLAANLVRLQPGVRKINNQIAVAQ
jgi:osmotically-inducible protein OsmY